MQEDLFSKEELFPLKKYKGEPMSLVLQDRQYCDWLVAQNWFRDEHKNLYQIIINYYGEPGSTPEHNTMQTRFLNDDFCFALGYLCKWRLMTKKWCLMNLGRAVGKIKEFLNKNDFNSSRHYEKLEEINDMKNIIEESITEVNGQAMMDNEPYYQIDRRIEEEGWDIIIKTNDNFCKNECVIWKDCSITQRQIAVELKPSIGDDYPVILRKMKAAKFQPFYKCLVYDKFSASGATLDELKKNFNNEDILVFSMSEIEEVIGKYTAEI